MMELQQVVSWIVVTIASRETLGAGHTSGSMTVTSIPVLAKMVKLVLLGGMKKVKTSLKITLRPTRLILKRSR